MSEITDAVKNIEAPVGGEFKLVDKKTTMTTLERDMLKLNFGNVRPPSKDTPMILTAIEGAVKESYPGKLPTLISGPAL